MRFSLRSLFLVTSLIALVAAGTRWWLRVSEERRWLSEFDPTRDQIFDWPDDRKESAKAVLDEMRAELMDAAYFGCKEHKLAICRRYVAILEQSHDKWDRLDLGRLFAELGDSLGFTEDEMQMLVAGLGYDVRTGNRIWPRSKPEAPERRPMQRPGISFDGDRGSLIIQ